MQAIWDRLEFWLKVNMPEVYNDLLPGATDEEIHTAEELMNIEFPEDVKVSYQIHNGQLGGAAPMMGEWQLLPMQVIMRQWQIMQDLIERGEFANVKSRPSDGIRDDWWNSKWIPLGYNGAGDFHCLDLEPSLGGEVGQIISFWHVDETREKLANNFREWLQQFADDLEVS